MSVVNINNRTSLSALNYDISNGSPSVDSPERNQFLLLRIDTYNPRTTANLSPAAATTRRYSERTQREPANFSVAASANRSRNSAGLNFNTQPNKDNNDDIKLSKFLD